jgi:hypothetical protein
MAQKFIQRQKKVETGIEVDSQKKQNSHKTCGKGNRRQE